MVTRRVFVRGSAIVMAGMGVAPGWLARAATIGGKKRKTLVAIFMRGAADGLNIVVPFGDKRYKDLRPTIAIAPPATQTNGNAVNGGTIDLDGTFGLNGAMQPLRALWDKKQLAIVEATGSPDPSRSHFEAQDSMECGTPGKATGTGWLNRALPEASGEPAKLRAVAMGKQVPHCVRAGNEVIAVGNLQQFTVGDSSVTAVMQSMYATTPDASLGRTGKDAFEAMKVIQSIQDTPPNTTGVASFCQEMGDRMEDIVLVTMSEFGRTAAENGNVGTDHGHGSFMMVAGGPVHGGKVYGKWPGLEKEQLFEGRDLAVTTDYRDVLSELVRGHLGQQNLSNVFPGFQPVQPLGLL